jgi:hypothetical protein
LTLELERETIAFQVRTSLKEQQIDGNLSPILENFTLIWASWVVGRLVVSPRVKKMGEKVIDFQLRNSLNEQQMDEIHSTSK